MDANDRFDGKPTNLNCFYMHTIFEQKYLKPAIVLTYLTKYQGRLFLSIIFKSIMHERKWVQLTKLSIRFQNQSRLVVELLVWWCNFSHIYVKLGSVQICTMSKEWIESSIIGFSFKCVQYKIFYFLDFRNISYR